MKRLILPLAAIPLLFTSCATTGGNPPPTDLIAPVASVATSVVLSKVKTADERRETAAKLVQIADAVALVTSKDTTGSELAALVASLAGSKPEYAPYAAALGLIFDRYAGRLGNDKVAQITADIAEGIKLSANPYL